MKDRAFALWLACLGAAAFLGWPAMAQTDESADASASSPAATTSDTPAETEASATTGANTETGASEEASASSAPSTEAAAAPAATEAAASQREDAAASDSGPATEADETAADEDDDDDWDTPSGPVDRTPHVSGAFASSFRGTLRSAESLPDGTKVEDEYTFQIEHTHLKFSGDLSEKLSWEVMPCLTHMNDFSVVTVKLDYVLAKPLHIVLGRFLLPFGQFNLRSMPGTFDTVSRPLLYQSHEDRMIFVKDLTPENFLFTPRDDTGIQLYGNVWAGDYVQISYNLYVTNGLRGVSQTMARFWDDNNNGKQAGGRVSVSYNGEHLTAAAAGSFLMNEWAENEAAQSEDEEGLNQRAWAVDATLAYSYATGKRITLRGEYVDMVREILPTDTLLSGDEGVKGAYVTLNADLTSSLAFFYQFDTLTNRTPLAQQNEAFRDRIVTATRHVAGLSYAVTDGWMLRLEYGHWNLPSGVPDADRLSVQTILTF